MNTKFFALLASLTLFTGLQAQASVVHVTYTGTVTGTDKTGSFGGGSLEGKSFVAKFDFEVPPGPNTLSCVNCPFQDGITNNAIGGTLLGAPFNVSPNLGASLEVDGTTVSFLGDVWGNILGSNGAGDHGTTQQIHEAKSATQTLSLSFFNNKGTESKLPGTIDTLLHFVFVDGFDKRTGSYCVSGKCITLLATTLDVTLASDSPTSQTPLPGALPLFATGLGALGFIAHRRKRRARVA